MVFTLNSLVQVGNWSRWLTDLVGIDAEDSPRVGGDSQEDNNEDVETTFSSFPLLNATSDLLMLPKDMLMEKSIRKEVRFSYPVISEEEWTIKGAGQ
jgi:hypothetical protein